MFHFISFCRCSRKRTSPHPRIIMHASYDIVLFLEIIYLFTAVLLLGRVGSGLCHAAGECVPLRVFLKPYALTPTYRATSKFSVKYFLNLVLVDEEDRR